MRAFANQKDFAMKTFLKPDCLQKESLTLTCLETTLFVEVENPPCSKISHIFSWLYFHGLQVWWVWIRQAGKAVVSEYS